MDLDFTDEQNLLRETVSRICTDCASTAVVRDMENDPLGYSQKFWTAFSEAGLCGLRIPEEHNGVGMGLLETAIVYEEMGRALAPSPHYSSAILAARLLELTGSTALAEQWLPAIADGSALIVPAWEEVGTSGDIDAIQAIATRNGENLQLQGEKILVPFANSAKALLVTVKLEGRPALVLIKREDLVLAPRQMPNHAGQSLYAVSLDGLTVGESSLIAMNINDIWNRTMLEGLIALAAQAIGGAQRILEMTIDYAKQREQFGQPIGAFQAIAHYLADCATEVAGARYLAYQAAWACDNGRPFARLALMAKWQTTAVFRRATFTGIQIHGGIGYSLEADPQLYYRSAKHQELMYWAPLYLEQRIAAEVFEG